MAHDGTLTLTTGHGANAHKNLLRGPPEREYSLCRIAKVRGGKGTFFEYPGEGHAFMNASTDIVENMKAAGLPIGKKESQDTAWERLFAFFQEQLG